MKKVFKTNNFCRNLANVIRVVLLVLVCVAISYTLRIYYINQQSPVNPQFTDGELEIVMIEVRNGDCFLVLQNDKAMLIDTGFLTTYSNVEKVLEEYNVQKIDYAILTHPHPDHVDGSILLFLNYKVDNLYMSEDMGSVEMSVSEQLCYTTITSMIKYNNLFANNVVDVIVGESDYDFHFANSQIQFLGPLSNNYKKLNNYSLVFKMTYGDNSILFTGDMEIPNEEELINANVDVSADIIKIAHHGSSTSTSEEFLDAVNPKYAMVSSDNGNHNRYGHPVKRIVESLEKRQIPFYRTDELGTVKLKVDGKRIIFEQDPGDYRSGTQYLEEKNKFNRM